MPRRPKPLGLKVLEGTDRPDRHRLTPAFEPTEGAEPPGCLKGDLALGEWRRVVPPLEAERLLTHADLTAPAHYCAAHHAVAQAWADGDVPTPELLMELRRMASDFGITPATRTKVERGPMPTETPLLELMNEK